MKMRRIGASHHFLRTRRKAQSWEKMENLDDMRKYYSKSQATQRLVAG